MTEDKDNEDIKLKLEANIREGMNYCLNISQKGKKIQSVVNKTVEQTENSFKILA